jgi:hypothetical protein
MKRAKKVTKGPVGIEGEGNNEESSRSGVTEAAAATGSELADSHDASDSASLPRVRAAASAATTTHNASSTTALSTAPLPNDNDEQEPTPLALQPTTEPIIVANVTENDVLLGRGATIINHVGNQRFHQLVLDRKQEYNSTWRHQIKDSIARKIFVFITEQRNGRFLRRIDSVYEAQALGIPHDWTTMWLVADPNVAIEKIKQALRDKHAKRSRAALAHQQAAAAGDAAVAAPAAQQQPPPPPEQQQPPPPLPHQPHAAAAFLSDNVNAAALPLLPAVAPTAAAGTMPGLNGFPLLTNQAAAAAAASLYNYLPSAPAVLLAAAPPPPPPQQPLLLPPTYMGLLVPMPVPNTNFPFYGGATMSINAGLTAAPPLSQAQWLQQQHHLLQQQQYALQHQQLLQQQQLAAATVARAQLPSGTASGVPVSQQLLQFLQSQAAASTTATATGTTTGTATTTSGDGDHSTTSTLSDRQPNQPALQLDDPMVPVLMTTATTMRNDNDTSDTEESSDDDDDETEIMTKRSRYA